MGQVRTLAAALAVATAVAGGSSVAAGPKAELYYFVTGVSSAEDVAIEGPLTLSPAEAKAETAAREAKARLTYPAAKVRTINTWGDYRCLVVIKAKGSQKYGERRSTNREAADRDAKTADVTGATVVEGPICAK